MNDENARAFARFRKELDGLLGDFDASARRVVTAQANVGRAVTVRATPVDTGYLKKAWLRSRTIKRGNAWIGSYVNPVEYGVYVNYGHRTVNKKHETTGWVPGYNMLEKGVDEADRQLPALFDAEIARVKRETGF